MDQSNHEAQKVSVQKRRLVLSAILLGTCVLFLARPVSAEDFSGQIVIVTTPKYERALRNEISQYQRVLYREGFQVDILSEDWISAEQIKHALTSSRYESIDGAIMLGNVPAALVKRGKEEPRPCALFMMDLNGQWTKAKDGGDYYSGVPEWPEINPEIWVGYITAETLDGDPVEYARVYLERTVRYHESGTVDGQNGALTFIDDEWAKRGASTLGLEEIYHDKVTVVNNSDSTTAARYREELAKTYEFIHLIAHNNHGFTGHRFAEKSGVANVDYKVVQYIQPKALFYNLGICSNACFTQPNYAGGWYLFGGEGLVVLGTTMPGAMNKSDYLYARLAEGVSFGEALKEWFHEEIPRDLDSTNRRWYLSVVLLGDPTIRRPRVTSVQQADFA
ncbi:MAG: hypothetical protein JW893_04960 [Candidatus Omnitrophica bacterium]|nr:hypothetical protein [Candidatus Omnitrophota bacterium]